MNDLDDAVCEPASHRQVGETLSSNGVLTETNEPLQMGTRSTTHDAFLGLVNYVMMRMLQAAGAARVDGRGGF